jgi:hypothetical protein
MKEYIDFYDAMMRLIAGIMNPNLPYFAQRRHWGNRYIYIPKGDSIFRMVALSPQNKVRKITLKEFRLSAEDLLAGDWYLEQHQEVFIEEETHV